MTRQQTEGYDWLLGAGGKRIVLTALFGRWDGGWSAPELARMAEVEPKRTAQSHLARLSGLGLAERHAGLWYPTRGALAARELSALLEAIDPDLAQRARPRR